MLGDVAHRIGCRSRSIRCSVVLTGAAAISIVLALAGCGSGAPGTTVVGGTTTVIAHGHVGTGPAGYSVTVSVAGGALSTPEVTVPAGSGVVFMNAEDDTNTKHHLVADDGSFDTRPSIRALNTTSTSRGWAPSSTTTRCIPPSRAE